MEPPRYDTIGTGYARTRREDPRLRERAEHDVGLRLVVARPS